MVSFAQIIHKFICIYISFSIRKPFDEPVLFIEGLSFSIEFMSSCNKRYRDGAFVLSLKEVDESGGGTSKDGSAFAFVIGCALSLH